MKKTKSKDNELLDFMAKACHYAQSHCGCPQTWGDNLADREYLLQCTSFQIACFLAQNTVEGVDGVEWNIVIDKLVDTTLDKNGIMCKSEEKWKKILQKIVNDLGGWKTDEMSEL